MTEDSVVLQENLIGKLNCYTFYFKAKQSVGFLNGFLKRPLNWLTVGLISAGLPVRF